MKRILIFIVLLQYITFAGLFDDRYPSARALAMSGAYVAIANDVWAGYYNPAGLSDVQDYHFGAAYQRPFNLSFFRNYFISGAAELPGDLGAASVSFQDFGVDYENNELSTEYNAVLSHGFYIMKDIHSSLAIGYNLKYYYWKLGQSITGIDLGAGSALGVDLGLQGSIYNRTFFGVYVLNINSPSIGAYTSYELPRRIVIGAAYIPRNGVTTALAMNKTVGLDTQVEGGFEFDIVEFFSLRLGASTNPNRLSAGIGIRYQGLHFDYALQTHPVLAETHLFGLTYVLKKDLFD